MNFGERLALRVLSTVILLGLFFLCAAISTAMGT
jgi:Na+/H+ antiporter NhaC